MKLNDLVDAFQGNVTFVVTRAIEGGVEDVVTFLKSDAGAIKDSILNSNVDRCSSEYVATTRTVLIKAMLEAQAPDGNNEGDGT